MCLFVSFLEELNCPFGLGSADGPDIMQKRKEKERLDLLLRVLSIAAGSTHQRANRRNPKR